MIELLFLLSISVVADFIFADPQYKLHPIRIIGRMIHRLELYLQFMGLNGFVGGVMLLILSNLVVLGLLYGLLEMALCASNIFYLFVVIYFIYSAIGFESLLQYAKKIARFLSKKKVKKARKTLFNIVGRDVTKLNQSQIVKATIESVSENFVDGFLAPIFWFIVGALVGSCFELQTLSSLLFIYLYKVTNTLDSMVGYRNKKYELFGKASAKFDDLLNFIPARLSVFIISITALFLGLDAMGSFLIAKHDRLKHSSPNSAHPESAVAGALNIRLGGPTNYSFGLVNKPYLAEHFQNPQLSDLIKSIQLIKGSAILFVIAIIILLGIQQNHIYE